MISTKGRSERRAINDAPSASDTILGYSDPSHHNTKIVYRSKEGGGSSSMLFQYEKKSTSSKSSWLDERSLAHRHSDGTILSSNLGKLPVWMTKPGSHNYRRYRSIPNFLAGEPYGYSNIVYNSAALIFERLAIRKDGTKSLIQYGEVKKDDVEPLQFDAPKIKRQAFELAYQALKYQELLEEILINSGFLFAHPMVRCYVTVICLLCLNLFVPSPTIKWLLLLLCCMTFKIENGVHGAELLVRISTKISCLSRMHSGTTKSD